MASNLSHNFHAQTSEVGEPLALHNPLHCFFKRHTNLAAEYVNHVVSFANSNFTIYNIKKKQEIAAIKKVFLVAKQQAGLDASAHFIPEVRSHNTE